ncbi:hypothetical protein V1512DRAFT_256364 [Lipomyces arxii]|uniref:uncharacterized protein n=1 Tax=Lipomyces arxii TaxID=56418 RepID=UPI0034CD4161
MPDKRESERLQAVSVRGISGTQSSVMSSVTQTPNSKKFNCLYPGCGKTFNRKDYLARHSANRELSYNIRRFATQC